jgi:hypothetical protein
MATSVSHPCPRICIDDLCRGNRDNTLCGGSYCDRCGSLTYDEGRCDDCSPEEEDFYDENENDSVKDGYA